MPTMIHSRLLSMERQTSQLEISRNIICKTPSWNHNLLRVHRCAVDGNTGNFMVDIREKSSVSWPINYGLNASKHDGFLGGTPLRLWKQEGDEETRCSLREAWMNNVRLVWEVFPKMWACHLSPPCPIPIILQRRGSTPRCSVMTAVYWWSWRHSPNISAPLLQWQYTGSPPSQDAKL